MGESILLVGMLHFLVNYKSFHSDLFTIKSIAIATPNWDDLDEWTNKSAQTPISEKKVQALRDSIHGINILFTLQKINLFCI